MHILFLHQQNPNYKKHYAKSVQYQLGKFKVRDVEYPEGDALNALISLSRLLKIIIELEDL